MRKYILFSSLIIIVIMMLPLFWLKLVQWAFLDDKVIIAEGISLSGAILGGAISGFLTLFGVKLTIDSNEKEKQLNTIPRKIMIAENLIYQLRNLNFNVMEKVRWEIGLEVEKITKENLNKCAEVNYKFYNSTRKIYDQSREFNRSSGLSWVEFIEIIDDEIKNMEAELKVLKEVINNS